MKTVRGWFRRLGFRPPRIFVSYRRSDSGGHAARLTGWLSRDIGDRAIFLDHEAIEAGEDFEVELHGALEQAEVMLVVIGPEWTNVARDGGRRLEHPDDWVRREVVTALGTSDLKVIPVLVGGAELPEADDLPEPLQPLLRRQARTLRNDRFEDDYDHLRRSFGLGKTRVLGVPIYGWIAATLMTVALAAGVLFVATRTEPLGPMTGDFNVVVASFAEVLDGEASVTDESAQFSDQIYGLIDDELTTLNSTEGFAFEVRGAG